MSKPKKPAVSLQQLFDNAPSWSEMEQLEEEGVTMGKEAKTKAEK